MAPKCGNCCNPAILKRPKTHLALCKECFFSYFEEEIHQTIITENLFKSGDVVGIGASGGKDSTVLIHVLKTLNQRYNYGLKLVLISIDEGISGYRDDSLQTVLLNQKSYDIPLKILSYRELYGWTMDEIVKQVGSRNNCTICGVFRRQALDRGAMVLSVNKIATGHNADDMAETVLMNVLRGDSSRLSRCTSTITDSFSALHPTDGVKGLLASEECITRCKPLKYCYQKEIVMYAHFKKLDYFATECTYAPNSFRGYVRSFLKDLERLYPSSILNIIRSGESFYKTRDKELNPFTYLSSAAKDCQCLNSAVPKTPLSHSGLKNPSERGDTQKLDDCNIALPAPQSSLKMCARCSYISSQEVCKACTILEKLNLGRAALVISKHVEAQNIN